MNQTPCELCSQAGGEVLHRTRELRVVLVDDAQYPGFCRVIWNHHIKELTDLTVEERALMMSTVWRVEAALRAVMQPEKINLASLGNVTPHLHWHVIPRHLDDAHFPGPVWAQQQRTAAPDALAARAALLPALRAAIVDQLELP